MGTTLAKRDSCFSGRTDPDYDYRLDAVSFNMFVRAFGGFFKVCRRQRKRRERYGPRRARWARDGARWGGVGRGGAGWGGVGRGGDAWDEAAAEASFGIHPG